MSLGNAVLQSHLARPSDDDRRRVSAGGRGVDGLQPGCLSAPRR